MLRLDRTKPATDWLLITAAVLLSLAGLVTMHTFVGDNAFFARQLVWLGAGLAVMTGASLLDARMLRRSGTILALYLLTAALLALVLVVGTVVLGARSRFDLGWFAFQPADLAQLTLVLVLAKYFTRRHVEIAHWRHVLVSGAYAFVYFVLLFLQPDFGSAMIVFAIWLGMVLIAGISWRHLAAVFLAGAVVGGMLWTFAFQEYQKERVLTFLNPLADVQDSGYNAYQSVIAVGSGELIGKGVGYGTQSKLEFLPEYETDFIFAAFAEEWGFLGVAALFGLFGLLFWRLLYHARYGETNFESLVASGIVLWFLTHLAIHVGINVGIMPVTGTTIPFLSYGGSHLMTEFLALGIVLAMNRYARNVEREVQDQEFEAFTA